MIIVNVSGEYVSDKRIEDWKRQLINYDLEGTDLKINNLKSKILNVSMNEYEVKSEVMFVLPFLLGHSVWFNMGRYKIDDHIELFKNTSLYEVKILNDGSFIATDYFDIPNNHWNIEDLRHNLEKGRNELDALYRKYEYDVDKLKIVNKRIKDCFKAIKKDKKLNTKRLKEIRIRSMTPKRKTRKASRSMNSI